MPLEIHQGDVTYVPIVLLGYSTLVDAYETITKEAYCYKQYNDVNFDNSLPTNYIPVAGSYKPGFALVALDGAYLPCVNTVGFLMIVVKITDLYTTFWNYYCYNVIPFTQQNNLDYATLLKKYDYNNDKILSNNTRVIYNDNGSDALVVFDLKNNSNQSSITQIYDKLPQGAAFATDPSFPTIYRTDYYSSLPTAGLQKWWKFEGNYNDSGISPLANLSVESGGSVLTTAGIVGNAVDTTVGILSAAANSFSNSSFTISAWIKRTVASTGTTYVISYRNTNYTRWVWVVIDPSGLLGLNFTYSGGNTTVNSTSPFGIIPLNKWTFICISVSRNQASYYINSGLINITTLPGILDAFDGGAGFYGIGLYGGGGDLPSFSFKGLIDDVRIYSAPYNLDKAYRMGIGYYNHFSSY